MSGATQKKLHYSCVIGERGGGGGARGKWWRWQEEEAEGRRPFFRSEDRGGEKRLRKQIRLCAFIVFCSKSGHFARRILCLVLYVGESHKHYNNDCSSPPLPYFPLLFHRERGRHEGGKFVLSHTSFSPPFLLPGHHKNLFFSPPTAIHSCLSLPVRRRCKRFSNFRYFFLFAQMETRKPHLLFRLKIKILFP